MHVPSSVIENSVIGPVLFGVYINDITDVITSSGASLYADDLKLWRATRYENDRVSLRACYVRVVSKMADASQCRPTGIPTHWFAT
jgi:hypothetical protein